MKEILVALLLVLGATPLWAQSQQKSAILFYNYDLTSTSYIYCKYLGQGSDPWQATGGMAGPSNVTTPGSSTTVAAVTAGTNPFAQVAVGDLLYFKVAGTDYFRLVSARASADSITVDTAITLAADPGSSFRWYQQKCGTTAADGWLPVDLFANLNFNRVITTFNATSIDSQVECKLNLSGPTTILDTKNATATGGYTYMVTSGVWDTCRLGMKINTDTGAQSISAAIAYNRWR